MITEEKSSNKKRLFKILIVLILIICIIILAQFAWAKYMAKVDGQATAQIAEMKFKINGDYYKSTDEIEFALTITKQNPKVASGMLAPGTVGYIPIIIDATDTQTSLEYEISIDLTNRPTNLKFYSDSNKTEEILVMNDNIIRRGYISLDTQNDKIQDESIYWEWITETGENKYEINQNDLEDSKFMDKIMTMQINVTGTQIKENPVYLAQKTNIGDIIKYKSKVNGISLNLMVVNQTKNITELMLVDENGYAENIKNIDLGYCTLESNDETKRKESIESYNKAIMTLNEQARKGFFERYGFNKASRALNVEDVNRLTEFIPNSSIQYTEYGAEASGIKRFIIDNETKVKILNEDSLEEQIFMATDLTKNGIKILAGDTLSIGEIIDAGKIQTITLKATDKNKRYSYSEGNKALISKYFDESKGKCWLASRCISYGNTEYCLYNLFAVHYHSGEVSHCSLYNSAGSAGKLNCGIVPVISIPSTTHTRQITDENNPDKVIWEVTE